MPCGNPAYLPTEDAQLARFEGRPKSMYVLGPELNTSWLYRMFQTNSQALRTQYNTSHPLGSVLD